MRKGYIDDVLVVAQLDVVTNLIVVDLREEGHVVQTLLLHHVHPFCLLLTGGLKEGGIERVQIHKGTPIVSEAVTEH